MDLKLDDALKLAKKTLKEGSAEEAKRIYQDILRRFPANKKAKTGLKALSGSPVGKFQKILDIPQDQQQRLINLFNQGQLQQALDQAKDLLEQFPHSILLHNICGAVYAAFKQYDAAIDSYKQALKIKPDYAEAHSNMGNALQEKGELDAAIDSYKQTLKIKPDYAEAHSNMGVALKNKGELDAAIDSYKQALKIKPDYAEAHYNMGNALKEKGEPDAAIDSYKQVLKIKPDFVKAHYNMGTALKEKGELDAAIDSYKRALKIKPDYVSAKSQMLHQLQHICDFTATDALEDASLKLGIKAEAMNPFAALSWADSSEQQLARSKVWVSEKYKQKPLPLPSRPQSRPTCIKIGYFSADFHDHATMYLMAGLLRDHDNDQFELYAYSYGRSKAGNWRQRAEEDVHHFFDVTDMSDRAIADLARAHALDITVDLKGYTQHTRSGIFQHRLAPIQVNYLGYPGSMGASFIDYIIADPIVIPNAQRQFYSENVIYLPHTYQPNDDARMIAATTTTRTDFGLPEDAFVFCCFNNNYKISPREFDIWMRLLKAVDGSVLWLLKSNKWAEQNLCKEAGHRGIDISRLVFADRLPHSEHLARHKHADLFIDTFNVNAHTTASDALWSALPIVTKQGNQFASRVAASLLTAVGLPELIVETEEEYECLIHELATKPQKLSAIKEKLAEQRLTEPLFDTKRYTRNFEAGLKAAFDLYFEDHNPQDIWVKDTEV